MGLGPDFDAALTATANHISGAEPDEALTAYADAQRAGEGGYEAEEAAFSALENQPTFGGEPVDTFTVDEAPDGSYTLTDPASGIAERFEFGTGPLAEEHAEAAQDQFESSHELVAAFNAGEWYPETQQDAEALMFAAGTIDNDQEYAQEENTQAQAMNYIDRAYRSIMEHHGEATAEAFMARLLDGSAETPDEAEMAAVLAAQDPTGAAAGELGDQMQAHAEDRDYDRRVAPMTEGMPAEVEDYFHHAVIAYDGDLELAYQATVAEWGA